jgi:hypothetical protein
MRGNAEGSTLRRSLGCLLSDELGIELRRVGSGKLFTFSTGEERLSQWMADNARVIWHVCDETWKLEPKLISAVSLPVSSNSYAAERRFPVIVSGDYASRKVLWFVWRKVKTEPQAACVDLLIGMHSCIVLVLVIWIQLQMLGQWQ